MVKVPGNTWKDERLREYKGNSTEFRFVFKSYSGVVARTTDLVALLPSTSKVRIGTSDRSATESWQIPKERKWGHNEKRKKVNLLRSSSSSTLVATDVDTIE